MPGLASAQTSWTNAGTGNWNNAGNWTAGVPTSATVITTINNGGTAQITTGADAGSGTPGATLTIGNGSTLDLQAAGSLNFETMVIQGNSTFKAANDNWGGGCTTPCIVLGGGTFHSAIGSTVYWDGLRMLTNTTSTIKTDAGLAWEPGKSTQHPGLPTIIDFQSGSVLQIGGPGVVAYSGGASVTSVGTTGLVILSGGTLRANNPQIVPSFPFVGFGLHELTSVVTTTTVQAGGVLDFNLGGALVGTTINNLQGAGEVKTGLSGTVLSLGQGNFSGNISGGSDLTLLSGGVTTLSGINTYTGSTNVSTNSTLFLSGSIASSFLTTVNGTLSGGTLLAPGILGNTVINGTLSPGNGTSSLGQLNTGTLQFNAGSTYVVNANAAGQSDKVVAGAPLTINGGTVSVVAAAGAYNPTTTYTIVSSSGRTGTFTGASSNLAFLAPTLSYTSTDVLLTLTRKAMFAGVANTPNQASVATALDTLATNNPLFLALLGLTAEDARKAFDLLSGELYASVQSVLMLDSQYVRQMLLARMTSAQGGALASSVYGADGPYGLGMGHPNYRPAPASWSSWAHAVGGWGKLEGDGNAAGVDRSLGGFFAGLDGPVGQFWRAGLMTGFTHSDVTVGSRFSSAGMDTGHLAAYASARWSLLNVRLGGAFAWHDIDAMRTIGFPGFVDATRASYDGQTGQLFGELGLAMNLGTATFEPFAGLSWVHLQTGGLSETGGPAALSVDGSATDMTSTTVGIRLGATYALANGITVLPRVSVAWQHAFGDVDPAAGLAFRSGSSPFVIAGAPLARDSALVDAGFDVAFGSRGRLGIAYGGTWSDSVSDHSVKGSATWRF